MHVEYAVLALAKGLISEKARMLKHAWWKGFRAARSSQGYSVNLLGPKFGVEYREGDHVTRIGVEKYAVDVDWVIYMPSKIDWLPPYQHEPVSEEKRQQVRERVIECLDFLKIKYSISD
jgi:hypothetical protein